MKKMKKNNCLRKGLLIIFLINIFCGVFADNELVGCWRFDEASGTSAADSSDYNNDGTISGATWVDGCLSGSALYFDGINDKITVNNPSGLSSAQGTLEFWMKADTNRPQISTICKFQEAAPGEWANFIRCALSQSGLLDLYIEDGDVAKINVWYDLDKLESGYEGQWLHIVWVQDGNGIILYVNGKEKSLYEFINSGSWFTSHLTIAQGYIGSGWDYFKGTLDEFKIYNYALSAEEINYNYIVGYLGGNWHFDEASGIIAADYSDYVNNGTVSGSATRVDGVLGNALHFDGIDDKVTVSFPTGIISEKGAMEFWMKATCVQYGTIFKFQEAAPGEWANYIRCHLYSNGILDLEIEDGNIVKALVSYDLDNLAGGYVDKWIHVLWVQDGTSIKLYINGEQKTLSGTNSGDWWTEHLTLAQCYIGSGWDYFEGDIDEFKIYKRAVDTKEAYQLYVENGWYKDFGCESNPTGDPIGGGSGYSDILTTGDYVVTNKQEMLDALDSAVYGDVVYVNVASIDLTGETDIIIPGGVTLAGNRGYNGTAAGALLYANQSDTPACPLLITGGSSVRITGLRIQGPHSEIGTAPYDPPFTRGIEACKDHADLEVDNCEISGWSHAGVYLGDGSGSVNADIHHNYIHHCQRTGLGYGVCLGYYGTIDCLIEANKFEYNRHSVAGAGTTGNSYEARYNHVLENASSSVFDMHGGADRGDGTDIAGDSIYIHHNTVEYTGYYSVKIRGIPNNEALIYHNWFYPDVGDAAIQNNVIAIENFSVYDNLYTDDKYYKSYE